jgi:hypothetical protein
VEHNMYFSKFPTTEFKGKTVLDITRKAQLDTLVKASALAYMNYTVEEGEKPEDVAFYYYDSVDYAWLVLSSNNIVDPYTQWPKTEKDLDAYIKVHYATQAGTTGDAVLEWTKNSTIGANIIHYQSHSDPNITLNRASYLNSSTTEKAEYYPVRVYDYEFALNESRRQIVLVNKALLPTITDQLERVLHD